ncbi:ferritin-like domain-containing protein [Solirubrobacter phytolaccae]|uniref:Ferritin-like domain-containing protein n=1 Tax=Solirubrobacter phytolaccae TaxID=1404360 RepID=A0A9X3N5S0_9ACTN|nr:ferritin-like domain-containing protein [Solirubrobacter phytolaccae]MDA0178965.1 ferritin-like domain-containing protein [Solirubrobacter phytolaccae]
MTSLLNLAAFDKDGAIEETAHAAGATRADFFKRTGAATAGLVVAGSVFDGLLSPAHAAISSKPSKANDVKILNYALTLEFLEAAFYIQAVQAKALPGWLISNFAEVVAAHEDAHVRLLQSVLGSAAVKKPTFDFKDTITDQAKFMATAQVLEDTGVAAYAGQGPNIFQRPVVKAALSIHSVEARHASWVRLISGQNPAPAVVDEPKTEKQVLAAVTGTGFITG